MSVNFLQSPHSSHIHCKILWVAQAVHSLQNSSRLGCIWQIEVKQESTPQCSLLCTGPISRFWRRNDEEDPVILMVEHLTDNGKAQFWVFCPSNGKHRRSRWFKPLACLRRLNFILAATCMLRRLSKSFCACSINNFCIDNLSCNFKSKYLFGPRHRILPNSFKVKGKTLFLLSLVVLLTSFEIEQWNFAIFKTWSGRFLSTSIYLTAGRRWVISSCNFKSRYLFGPRHRILANLYKVKGKTSFLLSLVV